MATAKLVPPGENSANAAAAPGVVPRRREFLENRRDINSLRGVGV
jgi:hypothetical protein